MNKILIYFSTLLVIVSSASKWYDGPSRPYEFGYKLENNQHRSEKKDENGIIMGEFGFITADGVYHITVYATDENGNFKIVSMKNIKLEGLSPALGMSPGAFKTSQNEQTTTTQAPPTTTPKKQTSPPKYGCSNCVIPELEVTKVTPKFDTTERTVQGNVDSRFGTNAGTGSGATGSGTGPGNAPTGSGNGPSGSGNGPTGSGETGHGSQNANSGPGDGFNSISDVSDDTGTNNGGNQGHGNQQSGGGHHSGGQNQSGGHSQDGGNQSGNGNSSPGGHSHGQNQQSGQGQSSGNTQSGGGSSSSGPSNVGNRFSPNSDTNSGSNSGQKSGPGSSNENNSGKPSKSSPSAPSAEEMKQMLGELLYKFNYTVGFHGHNEQGDRSGNKEGSYFTVGRDGVKRTIEYKANEFGYQPTIKVEKAQPEETPDPETERENRRHDYSFKWFFKALE